MSKFILISVYGREIVTEQFDTYTAAYEQMVEKIKEEFVCVIGTAEEWDRAEMSKAIAEQIREHGCYNNEEHEFFVSKDCAWSNMDDEWKGDWSIVEVK